MYARGYLKYIIDVLKSLQKNQLDQIKESAEIMSQSIKEGGVVR